MNIRARFGRLNACPFIAHHLPAEKRRQIHQSHLGQRHASEAQILSDLIAQSPGDEGKWFATAKDFGLYELALTLVRDCPCDPKTLARAARDFADRPSPTGRDWQPCSGSPADMAMRSPPSISGVCITAHSRPPATCARRTIASRTPKNWSPRSPPAASFAKSSVGSSRWHE